MARCRPRCAIVAPPAPCRGSLRRDLADRLHDAGEHRVFLWPRGRKRSRRSAPTAGCRATRTAARPSSGGSRASAARVRGRARAARREVEQQLVDQAGGEQRAVRRGPASTRTSLTSSSARRASTARQVDLRRVDADALDARSRQPRAVGCARAPRVGAANTSTSPGGARMRAVGGVARRRSSTTRSGWRGVLEAHVEPRIVGEHGAAPVSTAPPRAPALHVGARRLAGDPLAVAVASAVRPSRLAATSGAPTAGRRACARGSRR